MENNNNNNNNSTDDPCTDSATLCNNYLVKQFLICQQRKTDIRRREDICYELAGSKRAGTHLDCN